MIRRAFTLVELLVVLAIIGAVAGIILSTPRADARDVQVKAAADELAAVLRASRAMAIERRAMYGVCFNIENQPGSSGWLLNNRGGGHWYRVIGPRDENAANLNLPGTGFPPTYSRNASPTQDAPIRYYLEATDRAWIGDRRILPAGKVRFVALTDQDNGNYRENGDTYPPTYPRPWFGWWDSSTNRLHAWGGYEPDLAMTAQTGASAAKHQPRSRDGRTISHSGFHYEGYDGVITGCRNPGNRDVFDDGNSDGIIGSTETTTYRLWDSDSPRPLINARWQDCMIAFRPDGTAFSNWMNLRHACATDFDKLSWPALTPQNLFYDPSLNGTALLLPSDCPSGKHHMMELGPADMCNRISSSSGAAAEGSWSASRSGYYFLTLGPDLATDDPTYPSASAALHSLMPLYRVGVSPFGDVVVRRIRNQLRSGEVYDTALTGADWNVKAKTDLYYRDHLLVNKTTVPVTRYTARGKPITDVLTVEMLRDRKWWWQ